MKTLVVMAGALAVGYWFGFRRAKAEDIVTANEIAYTTKLGWIDEEIVKKRKLLTSGNQEKNVEAIRADLECLKWYRKFFTEEIKTQKLWSLFPIPIPLYSPMSVSECDAYALGVIDNDGPYIRTAAEHIYTTGEFPR